MSHQNHGGGKPFSVSLFAITLVLSLAFYITGLAVFFPTVWRVQTSASAWEITIVFVLCHLGTAFFEYFFHRYVLHYPLIPGLGYFFKSHTRHHGLTHIVYRKVVGVKNIYPIIEEKQHEGSFFPWYSFLVFAAVFTVPLSFVQWLMA